MASAAMNLPMVDVLPCCRLVTQTTLLTPSNFRVGAIKWYISDLLHTAKFAFPMMRCRWLAVSRRIILSLTLNTVLAQGAVSRCASKRRKRFSRLSPSVVYAVAWPWRIAGLNAVILRATGAAEDAVAWVTVSVEAHSRRVSYNSVLQAWLSGSAFAESGVVMYTQYLHVLHARCVNTHVIVYTHNYAYTGGAEARSRMPPAAG